MRARQSSPPVASPSVSVAFPGAVSRESCCRFACELLKHVLYQRHQLPLPYEQLARFCWRAAWVRDPREGPLPGSGGSRATGAAAIEVFLVR